MRYTLQINPLTNETNLTVGDVTIKGSMKPELETKKASFEFCTKTKISGNKNYLAEVLSSTAPILKHENCSRSVSYGEVRHSDGRRN